MFFVEGGQFEYQTASQMRYQMKALVALAKLGGTNVFSSHFITQVGMPSTETLSKAMRLLLENRRIYLFKSNIVSLIHFYASGLFGTDSLFFS